MSVFVITKPNKPSTQAVPSEDKTVEGVSPSTDSKVTEDNKVTEEKRDKKVVIDGPLSRVYTDALNAVYANESAVNMFTLMINEENQLSDLKAPINLYSSDGQIRKEGDGDLYVYTIKTDNMKPRDSVETVNKLYLAMQQAKVTNDKVCLAVECDKVVPSHVDDLVKLSMESGVTVLWTRNQAIDAMKNTLS